MERLSSRLLAFFGTKICLVGIIAIFVLQTGYLALTSRFPMAFDESYHFGLIQFFSHHLNPIITSQAADTYRYGAIIQDPSFLYQYLLGFPYRLLSFLSDSFLVQLIALRCINIMLAVWGLLIMNRLLRLLGLSRGLAHAVLLAYAFTPIVTALSAQINYFNLLLPLVGLTICLTIQLHQSFRRRQLPVDRLMILLMLGLLSSLVAFAYLPILFGLAISVVTGLIGLRRRQIKLIGALRSSFRQLLMPVRIGLITSVFVSSFIFVRIYGVNIVRYHNLTPQCHQVLNIDACKHYYAWNRNYKIIQTKQHHTSTPQRLNTGIFTSHWLLVCVLYIYGAILPLHGLFYVATPYFALLGLIGIWLVMSTARYFGAIWRRPEMRLALGISIIYLFFLWLRNYHDYLQLGKSIAINGRYFVPVLILLYAVLISGLQRSLRRITRFQTDIKATLIIILVVLSLGYGGFSQYVIRIDPVYGHLQASDQAFMQAAWQ